MPHLTFTSIRSTVLAAALVACGNVDMSTDPDAGSDPTGDATTPDAGGADTTAPAVAAVTPADGTAGVAADAVIVVEFTEPMDQASVEAAWTSTDLPAASVGFAWSAAGDTLTVTPAGPLTYAAGVGIDPAVVAARIYAFEIAATATDLAGNPLAAAVTTSFTTKRRLRVDLAVIDALTRSMRGDGLVLSTGAVNTVVGDTSADLQYKTFVGFTLPQLPAGAVVELVTLSGSQAGATGSPYLLGAVSARHVNTATIDAPAFTAPPLADAGVFSIDTTLGLHNLDVTARVIDDLANHVARGDRTQFRLEFPSATNSNGASDAANFTRSSFAARLVYLID